jgi:hypothetical protein
MMQTHAFLRTDIFSHTFAGTPWINFEWLSQLVLYGIYVLGGLWGLYAAKILLCLAVVVLLVLSARRAGASGPVLFLLFWAGFKVVQPRLQDRPELFTLFFLGLLVWLVLWARGKNEAATRWLPLGIFGLMVLWVNSHGGFVYGLAFLILFTVGAVWAKEPRAFQRLLLKMSMAAAVALLFNPYGVKLGLVFWEHYQQMKNTSLIMEWKATNVAELPYFWTLYVAAVVMMAAGLINQRRETRFWTPVVVVFAAWGSLYYRNTALFAFAAVPFLASSVRLPKTPWYVWILAILPVTADVPIFKRPVPDSPVFWNRFPVKACDYVRDNGIQGRMFNTYDIGGYIMWALGPERKVFMDGRYPFYSLLQRFDTLSEGVQASGVDQNEWPRFLDEHGVDYAIVDYPDHFFRYSNGDWPFRFSLLNVIFPRTSWALVYWDDSGLVFLKRTPAFKKIIDRDEYKFVWPYNLEQMNFLLHKGLVKKSQARAELDRHRQFPGPTAHGQEIENLLEMHTSQPK